MALMRLSGAKTILPEEWLDAIDGKRTKIATGIVAFGAAYVMAKNVYKMYRIQKNNQKRQRKRANKESSIRQMEEKCQSIERDEVERIITLSFTELREKLQSGKLKPTRVLLAYQAKSLESHRNTNCITEYIKEAEMWATEADNAASKDQPLFGIPISLKEDIPLNGYDSTWGLIELCERPSDRDCGMVQMLRNMGAIPFCRTNVPQYLTAFEVSNPIFGSTCHPMDSSRISGGSSGGESSLIASGGSIFGMGSDLGGSIRNPSNFTGLCGFKATSERYSFLGHDLFAGQKQLNYEGCLMPVWGPLARDMDTVVAVTKGLLDGKTLNAIDPMVPPVPFNQEIFNDTKPLRIGYYLDNGLLTTTPSVKRAVRMAKEYLESKGHTLIEWLPTDIEATRDLQFELLFINGGADILKAVEYDTLDDCVKYMHSGKNIPEFLRPLAARLVEAKDPKMAKFIRAKTRRNIFQLWDISATVKQRRRDMMEAMRADKIDIILCPAWAYSAPPLKSADLCLYSESYTMLYNVLNFPAGVVRMTRVTEEDNQQMKHYPDTDIYHKRVKKAMEGSVGLPVGVQVVAPWYEDELCLRIMKEVEGAAEFHVMDK